MNAGILAGLAYVIGVCFGMYVAGHDTAKACLAHGVLQFGGVEYTCTRK